MPSRFSFSAVLRNNMLMAMYCLRRDLYVCRHYAYGELGRTVHRAAPMWSGAMGRPFELLNSLIMYLTTNRYVAFI